MHVQLFPLLALKSNAKFVYRFLWGHVFISRNGLAGSYGNSVFNLLRNSQSGCNVPYPHQQFKGSSFFIFSLTPLLFIMALLEGVGVKWYFVILICISFFFLFFFKYGTLHKFACHPCAGAMLIFSVLFQF